MWVLWCVYKCELWPNLFSHSVQTNGFSPVWALSRIFKCLIPWAHFEQVYGFSPKWILSFIFEEPVSKNADSHLMQAISSGQCVSFHAFSGLIPASNATKHSQKSIGCKIWFSSGPCDKSAITLWQTWKDPYRREATCLWGVTEI